MTNFSILVDATCGSPFEVVYTLESIKRQSNTRPQVVLILGDSLAEHQMSWDGYVASLGLETIIVDSEVVGGGQGWSKGFEAAVGTYVIMIRPGDRLLPGVLDLLSRVITSNNYHSRKIDIVYGDDFDTHTGSKDRLREKPAWSPELLRCRDYIGIAAAYRTELVRQQVKMHELDLQSGLYDLTLRVTESTDSIVHIPNVLLELGSQTAQAMLRIGNHAVLVQKHCNRIGIQAQVEQVNDRDLRRVKRRWTVFPLVSIIIPTRGTDLTVWGKRSPGIVECIRSIEKVTEWPNLELVVVVDEEMDPKVVQLVREVTDLHIEIVVHRGPFNFSRKINLGAIAASGDFFILLNDDTQPIESLWVHDLLGPLREADVGMTGAKLLYSDATIQHGGQFWCHDPGHTLVNLESSDPGYLDAALVSRECSGVTAACAAVRSDVFFKVGGMSELLPVNFNDVDFSLKIRTLDLRIVWVADAVLWHFEHSTREPIVEPFELEVLRRRWEYELSSDPYLVIKNLDPASRKHFRELYVVKSSR